MRDRKGQISQNVLAMCGLDLRFHYILSGWDGSATDSLIFVDARMSDLRIPPGRRYLADAGFGICDSLLVPYRGVRYHLAEWGHADLRFFSFCLLLEVQLLTLDCTDPRTRRSSIIYAILLHKTQ
jgi:hypothetical protein